MKNVLCVLVCVSFVILASAKDEVNVDKVLKTVGKNVRKVEPPMPRLPHLMLPPQFKEKLDNAAATASPTGVPTAESKSKLDNALSKMMADEDTKDMSRVVSGPHDLVDALKVCDGEVNLLDFFQRHPFENTYPHPCKCNQFYELDNLRKVWLKECLNNTVFNERANECVPLDYDECDNEVYETVMGPYFQVGDSY